MEIEKIVSKSFQDQLERRVVIPFPPWRIISLVPSQTELLFYLGLEERIVGITKFCIHPHEKFKSTPKVGGTKNLNLQKIKLLNPDLIIANKEENQESQIKELIKDYPVWISDIKTLEDAYNMIRTVGAMVDEEEKANELVVQLKSKFQNLNELLPLQSPPTAAYLIWRRPYMTVGSDTFIHEMLGVAGFKNIFADKKRYPEITIQDLNSLSPKYVLLSSEPYPFRDNHIEELQKDLPDARIILVDGEMFSWYGNRLIKSADYFKYLHTLL